jgi:hypothetical protein
VRKVKEIKEKEDENSLFDEIKFKSQAAMEYLMTYGWAILIIALTLAVLYSLGIMNPKNFLPRAPPGSCFVFRPNGPGTTDFISLQGTCGYLPMYVGSFNGVNAYIHITNGALVSPNKNFSVAMWALLNSNALTGVWRTLWREGGGTTRHLGITPSGYLGFQIQTSDGVWHNAVETVIFPKSSWQFIVATFSTTTGMKLYRNGVLTASDPNNVNNINGAGVDIGATPSNNIWWNGTIGNVQIYLTTLTPQEIQYLYQQGLGGGPVRLQNLVGWWPLNGDAKDYSGNNLHGTIYGGVTFVQNYNPP